MGQLPGIDRERLLEIRDRIRRILIHLSATRFIDIERHEEFARFFIEDYRELEELSRDFYKLPYELGHPTFEVIMQRRALSDLVKDQLEDVRDFIDTLLDPPDEDATLSVEDELVWEDIAQRFTAINTARVEKQLESKKEVEGKKDTNIVFEPTNMEPEKIADILLETDRKISRRIRRVPDKYINSPSINTVKEFRNSQLEIRREQEWRDRQRQLEEQRREEQLRKEEAFSRLPMEKQSALMARGEGPSTMFEPSMPIHEPFSGHAQEDPRIVATTKGYPDVRYEWDGQYELPTEGPVNVIFPYVNSEPSVELAMALIEKYFKRPVKFYQLFGDEVVRDDLPTIRLGDAEMPDWFFWWPSNFGILSEDVSYVTTNHSQGEIPYAEYGDFDTLGIPWGCRYNWDIMKPQLIGDTKEFLDNFPEHYHGRMPLSIVFGKLKASPSPMPMRDYVIVSPDFTEEEKERVREAKHAMWPFSGALDMRDFLEQEGLL